MCDGLIHGITLSSVFFPLSSFTFHISRARNGPCLAPSSQTFTSFPLCLG